MEPHQVAKQASDKFSFGIRVFLSIVFLFSLPGYLLFVLLCTDAVLSVMANAGSSAARGLALKLGTAGAVGIFGGVIMLPIAVLIAVAASFTRMDRRAKSAAWVIVVVGGFLWMVVASRIERG